ncbi:hypothetical protein V6Z11_A04G079600 [Gossypium hirsutum]
MASMEKNPSEKRKVVMKRSMSPGNLPFVISNETFEKVAEDSTAAAAERERGRDYSGERGK